MKKLTLLLTMTIIAGMFQFNVLADAPETITEYDASSYTRIESPSTVGSKLHLESNGTKSIDAIQKVSLKPSTEYLIVFDITKNTYSSGYFVAVRSKNFIDGNNILFPKKQTGEFRALFTTKSSIGNPYIWSYAYNNSRNSDMIIETTFKIYEASDFDNPLTDSLTPVEEEPIVEEPVVEEPVVEEPVVEEPIVEEPVVEEPIVEAPASPSIVTEITPIAEYDPSNYSRVESPTKVGTTLHLQSNGKKSIDALYDVTLKPSTEYLIVYDITKNTNTSGYFVAVRAKEFMKGNNITFPRGDTGEYRALFTTLSTINNPYIWSYAYNGSGKSDMVVESTFKIYEADQFDNPLTDSLSTSDDNNEDNSSSSNSTNETITGVKASDIGLVPNKSSSKDKNAELFVEAINKYGKLIIDDKYYIGTTGKRNTAQNVELYGTGNAELIFNYSRVQYIYDINDLKNLTMKNITITNNSSIKLLWAYSSTSSKTRVDSVLVEGCTFNGNVSLWRQPGNTSLNPNSVNYGVSDFVFNNNEIYNIDTMFMTFQDLPFDNVTITNNIVRNFSNIFINFGLTNGIRYNKALRDNRLNIVVKNNSVINDDDWWSDDDQMYHTFILAEADEILYDSNHVEGLKSKLNVAVYDAYLSCDTVTYTNNLWKNNISFYKYKTNNTLLKAKTGYDATRLYQDNTFIVEESFATRLGQSKSLLFTSFIDINAPMDSYKIIGNTFDVYDLRGQVSSREIKELVFNDNVIKAKYASGKLIISKVVDSYQSSIEFSNNIIDIEQNKYRSPASHSAFDTFVLIKNVDMRKYSSSKSMSYLTFTNNTIEAPLEYVVYSPYTEKLTINNNDITVVKSLYKAYSASGNQPSIKYQTVNYSY